MKEYTLTIGGVDHTVQLNDEDAKRLGATELTQDDADTKTTQPSNKSRSTKDKG